MKKLIFILTLTLVSSVGFSQKSTISIGELNDLITSVTNVVAYSTPDKDTLYLADNQMGYIIWTTWEEGYHDEYVEKRPVIIFEPQQAIVQRHMKKS
jgi:hypothetical protein